jgi:hypothetical protein
VNGAYGDGRRIFRLSDAPGEPTAEEHSFRFASIAPVRDHDKLTLEPLSAAIGVAAS